MITNRAGQQFGNYRLIQLLGEGDFAEVYLGEHIYLKTNAAIKMLKTRLSKDEQEGFLNEARHIARLEHPHIVRVMDFGMEDGIPYLIMNYAPLGSLRSHHPRGTTLPLDTIVLYVRQIAAALQYAHDEKLIHRDVKPENMLLGRSNHVLLSDFGIAVVAQSTRFQKTSDIAGTPNYMAPELFQGKPQRASDQYALGVIVYEWLSGDRPFQGEGNALAFQHVYNSPPSLFEKVPGLSRAIEQVVMTALAKDPHQRFASIQAFANALELACQQVQHNTSPHAIPSTPPHGERSAVIASPPIAPTKFSRAIQAIGQQEAIGQECFLCILDPQPCSVKKFEGYIIDAREVRSEGEMVPFITISLGTELAALTLTRYYRSLIQGLVDLGPDLHKRKLKLRVYHLPPAIRATENKGRLVHHYRANDYTLAILEPDTVLNITDLSHAEYCSRQYLLHRLVSSPPSAAAIRGNLVHYSFKELLKEHGGSRHVSDHANGEGESPLSTLQHHFKQTLERSSIDLALANTSPDEIRIDAVPHLESLAIWFQKQYATLWDMPAATMHGQDTEVDEQKNENGVRAETFLLAPEIGLRGRLDLFWKQTGRQRLLELKTGGAKGDLPNAAHRWQVQGYHALLAVRRDSKMKKALATLLYSGTPGEAQDFRILPTVNQLQRVIENRNTLVLSHVTGMPPAPPGPSRCTKCAMLEQCAQVSALLDWRPPEPGAQTNGNVGAQFMVTSQGMDTNIHEHNGLHLPIVQPQDRLFFTKYYKLLHLEGRESELQQALLWKTTVEERVERGTAINDIQPLEMLEQTEQGGWEQTFVCENTSELREGDEILLSDGNPITGEVVTGTIIGISAKQVRVWTPELIAHPRLIDRYDNSIVNVRTLQNLLRWLQANTHLRELVAGNLRPRFDSTPVAPRADFNVQQNLAVERAMQMRDYLLIHGPPGTGKTSVIAEIVMRLCQQGQRVMLAAFTNQAVDNMLKQLDTKGFSDYVRLGHERSVGEAVQSHLLQKLVEQEQGRHDTLQTVRHILRKAPVIASTTATWSSDKYNPPTSGDFEDNHEEALLQFDVAIIDEAGQLTVPAILGALRFAKRFILVGDEKQLPPLVLSKEAIEQGLADSLFGTLKLLDDDYTKRHPEAISACVPLRVQYRMNRMISDFASRTFYDGKLMPHNSVANAVLELVGSEMRFAEEVPSILQAIDPSHPMVFVDVRGELEGVKTSDAEARAVREVVAGLLVRGIAPKDIGIIAPYRAQVANLRRHLLDERERSQWLASAKGADIHEMSIDTVDRFQGGERKVIIISFATTTAPEVESQLREHLTNPNRLNVALTRAQQKLILVGCASALERLPVFERLLAYCHEMQAVIAHSPIMHR